MNAQRVVESSTIESQHDRDPLGVQTQWSDLLPVSINCAYGDPLLPVQVEDTLAKLRALSSHSGPVGFCTKGRLRSDIAAQLRELADHARIVVRYSLTGLDEAGYSFADRVDTIQLLARSIGSDNLIISLRPILPGLNDGKDNLEAIVRVAATYSGKLIIGGVHNEYKHKTLEGITNAQLLELCYKHKVKVFYKSSCAAAYVCKVSCWMHDLGKPRNLHILDQFGYSWTSDAVGVVLPTATMGDLNFARLVTGAPVLTEQLLSNDNRLSFSGTLHEFEVTSSWYAWARNTLHCLGCDYCIIKKVHYLSDVAKDIGVHPRQLLTSAKLNQSSFGTGRGSAYTAAPGKPQRSDGRVGYDCVRISKKCCTHAYD